MKKELPEETPLLDAEEARMETVRKAAECRYNDAVICGLYQKDPERCARFALFLRVPRWSRSAR